MASVIIKRLMKDKKITYLVNGKMKTYFRSAVKEKNCTLCDKPFIPNSGVQRYCEEHKRKHCESFLQYQLRLEAVTKTKMMKKR